MAPKIPSVIQCASAKLLELELSEVREGLDLIETEDTWDKISNAILRLKAITVGSAEEYPSQLIAACKSFVRPIINSLSSERSRLSGTATDLLTTLAMHLQRPFEMLIPLYVPTLLTLASRPNKIFNARAKACLLAITEHCGSPAIIPLLRYSISDKSVALRLTVIEVIVACLNTYNPPDLETPGRVEDIEAVIKATARDANADIRKFSRKAFEAYKLLFPARVDAFVAPLTPTMKKYLDVKNAAANQRKPLHSSSSAATSSAPSSSRQPELLSRSQPVGKVSTRSTTTAAPAPEPAATFTRVEKPAKSAAKPPSSSAAATADSALMPPPPPPQEKKSSSGPVRPPLAVRQALAAAATVPMRPKLGRHASRPNLHTSGTMAHEPTRSQPPSHVGPQRPEKAPSPPPVTEVSQPVSGSSEPVSVPAAGPSAPPARRQKLADILKQPTKGKCREDEKPDVATSSASSRADVHVFSHPPSHLDEAASNAGEEGATRRKEATGKGKRREEDTEARKRTTSHAEPVFHPMSHTAVEPHKRSSSKEQEMPTRPASRMETHHISGPPELEAQPVLSRTRSRTEKERARPESRAEVAAPEKPRKRRVEQHPDQPPQADAQLAAAAVAELLAKEERRRRRALRAAQAAAAAEALARAPSKRSNEERGEGKPSKKRREEAVGGELRRREPKQRVREAPPQDLARPDALVQGGSAPAVSHQATDAKVPEPQLRDASEYHVGTDVPLSRQSSRKEENLCTKDKNEAAEVIANEPESGTATEEEVACKGGASGPQTPTKRSESHSERHQEHCGVRPLLIKGKAAEQEGLAHVAESEIPLPPSPPPPPVWETPAPLRKAMAARKNQVPATPISKLIASIQRGFEADIGVIREETEGEALPPHAEALVATSAPEEVGLSRERVVREDHHRDHHTRKVEASDENPFFVDTRPRKLKSEHSKGRRDNGRKAQAPSEARVPFKPRADNH